MTKAAERRTSDLVEAPLVSGMRPTARTISSRPPRAIQERPRILIVDDQPQVVRLLSRILGKKYAIEIVEGGLQALALLQDDPHFDLILSDLNMPHMDGFTLRQQISLLHPELRERFVFCTGGVTSNEMAARLAAEPQVLHKPFSVDELERRAEALLAVRRGG